MKMRPQINGPIDVGYGNYILTAPAERNGRKETGENGQEKEGNGTEKEEKRDKESVRKEERKGRKRKLSEMEKSSVRSGSERRGRNMGAEGNQGSGEEWTPEGRLDVSELLSSRNTLTNPATNKKQRTEL